MTNNTASQSPNPDFHKIPWNKRPLGGDSAILEGWRDNHEDTFDDARKYGSDSIAAHGMRKSGSVNAGVKELFSLIQKGGIKKDRNRAGGLFTAPLTMDPGLGAAYGIGGSSSIRDESPFIILAKDGKDLSDSDNIGGILVNPGIIDLCEFQGSPCPDYVEKLAQEIHKIRPDIKVMPYTKVVDMTRELKANTKA